MTDHNDTSKNVLPPPTMRIGALRWLKENLFSSLSNTILTVVAVVLIVSVMVPTINWAVVHATWSGGPEACQAAQRAAIESEIEAGACWAVIPYNMKRLMSGSYPVDETFRIWITLAIFVGLFGLSTGMWAGLWRLAAAVVGVGSLLLLLFPFSAETRLWMLSIPISLGLATLIGHFLKNSKIAKRILIALWLISPVVIAVILGGSTGQEITTRQWGGLFLNFMIAVVGITLSFPLGVLLALGRRSKLIVIRTFSVLYIETIRGMPLIAIIVIALIMLRFFLPSTWDVDDLIRVMTAFTLFTAAYIAENVRGGLQSIPKGQEEAAQALGLSALHSMAFIVLPQALRAVIPANVGQFISLLKDTSLVYFAALLDILSIGLSILNEPQWPGPDKEMLIFIALSFWIFAYFMSYLSRKLEKQLGVGER